MRIKNNMINEETNFFRITRTKIMISIIILIILLFLNTPQATYPNCAIWLNDECPKNGLFDKWGWSGFIITIIIEVMISYLIACSIIWLNNKRT
ncbi:hypothetical protein COU61_02185 [Candidatus Pacearchaeota archaeon CG10_big_fil_rev_8_21_14_0_10_35_13]|nr:MAG: hypothetical protein COU61_02185 [Candidatus Pacearchaeota archaeon CG10_big_fil_rev_8_21_14_0_10_35_13]